jgi:formyltetrahydrofolate deformylase
MATASPTAILMLSCRDQIGLVAAVAEFVARHHGNIIHADQHTDQEEGVFFQRIEFELDGFALPREEILPGLRPLAERYEMHCRLQFSDAVPRIAVLVSHQSHCMYDLLGRWSTGELQAEIPVVISNHPDHAVAAEHFGVDYHHLPVTPATKPEQEAAMAALLDRYEIDVVVLARYMQILSASFVERYQNQIINIHHSFLPAFAGGRPYHQAYDRGVKIVGVTAHYVTAALDQGPIIDQDVVRVSHRDTVDDLVRKGRDLEKVVLARAVRAHLAGRVLVYGNKTVVFD